jgi:hypothetical protein
LYSAKERKTKLFELFLPEGRRKGRLKERKKEYDFSKMNAMQNPYSSKKKAIGINISA